MVRRGSRNPCYGGSGSEQKEAPGFCGLPKFPASADTGAHDRGRYGIASVLRAIGLFFDRVKRECDRDGFRRGAGVFAGFRVVPVLEVKSVFMVPSLVGLVPVSGGFC